MISRLRVVISPVLIAILCFSAACTPPPAATSCHAIVDQVWPASSRVWAHKIVKRESNGQASAQNKRSSAAGCFQLLRIHAPRFTKLGFSWSQRYNARANTLVALDLYREVGSSPWRL